MHTNSPNSAGAEQRRPASAGDNDDIVRPGISAAFLRRNNIRHVDESGALAAVGYKQPGILIPYADVNSPQLVVNGRPFCRLRLDRPTASAKYLSPRGAGAQLYIPSGPPFGKVLTVAESEFKSLSLNEAGIRAVGVGGISSALPGGALLPALGKLVKKYNPDTLFFLGDADTCFIYDFSREAIKLAKTLPAGTVLKLPRMPLGGAGNGIDDVRESLGDGFPAFWQQITEAAIAVDRRLTPEALAVKLIAPELPAVAACEDKELLIQRVVELSSHLDPLNLGLLAKAAGKALDLSVADFRASARQKAEARKTDAAQRAREADNTRRAEADIAQTANDLRPKIEIPASRDRLTSEFARELGSILAKHGFFSKDGIVVCPGEEQASLVTITGRAFRTRIEDYVIPWRAIKTPGGTALAFNRTISKEEAESVLESPQFIKHLPRIRARK